MILYNNGVCDFQVNIQETSIGRFQNDIDKWIRLMRALRAFTLTSTNLSFCSNIAIILSNAPTSASTEIKPNTTDEQ